MKLLPAVASASLAAALFFAHPHDAEAAGPITLELGGKAGVGTNPTTLPFNPYGFGLGASGGISLLGIYGGVNLVDYFGGSNAVVSAPALQYGVEAGFGITLLALTIRPQVGFGNLVFTSTAGDQSLTNNYLYVEPGITALITIGIVFVGADLNLLVVPSVDATALEAVTHTETSTTIHGQVGIRF